MCSCSRRWDYRRLLGGLTWLKLKTHDWRPAATPSGLAQMPSAWMWWQVASCSILPLPFNCPSLPFLNTFTVIDNHHWKSGASSDSFTFFHTSRSLMKLGFYCSFLSSYWTDFFLFLLLLLLVYWFIASSRQKIRQKRCKNAMRGSCYIS